MGTFDLYLAVGTGLLNWQKSLWLGNVGVSLQGSPLALLSPELPAAIRGDPGILTGSAPVGPCHSSAPLPHVLLPCEMHLCRADMPPAAAHGAWGLSANVTCIFPHSSHSGRSPVMTAASCPSPPPSSPQRRSSGLPRRLCSLRMCPQAGVQHIGGERQGPEQEGGDVGNGAHPHFPRPRE